MLAEALLGVARNCDIVMGRISAHSMCGFSANPCEIEEGVRLGGPGSDQGGARRSSEEIATRVRFDGNKLVSGAGSRRDFSLSR